MSKYTAASDGRGNVKVYVAESGVLSYTINKGSKTKINNVQVSGSVLTITSTDEYGVIKTDVYKDISKGILSYSNIVGREERTNSSKAKQLGKESTEVSGQKSYQSSFESISESNNDSSSTELIGGCGTFILWGIPVAIYIFVSFGFSSTFNDLIVDNPTIASYLSKSTVNLLVLIAFFLPLASILLLWTWAKKTFLGSKMALIISYIIIMVLFLMMASKGIEIHNKLHPELVSSKNSKGNAVNSVLGNGNQANVTQKVKFSPNTKISIQGNLNQQSLHPQDLNNGDCSQQQVELADAQLASTYHQLMSKLSPSAKSDLKRSELDWIKSKDAFIRANPNSPNAAALKAITDRTQFLQKILQKDYPQ